MAVPIRDQLLAALNALFDATRSAEERKAANDWLTLFKESPEAWQVLPPLLLDDELAAVVKQFAAVTLRRKLWAAAPSMSDADMKELRDTLLLCVLVKGQPAIVVRDLCSPLAFVAVYAIGWETALDDLAFVLPPNVMLMLLKELPSQVEEAATRTTMPGLASAKEKLCNWSSFVLKVLGQQLSEDSALQVITCFEQWVQFGALHMDDVPYDAAGNLIGRTFQLLKDSDLDPWPLAEAALAILNNLNFEVNGPFLFSLISGYPEAALKMYSEGDYNRTACLVDVYSSFCSADDLFLVKSGCPEGESLRNGLQQCLMMPATSEAVTDTGEPVITAAVEVWGGIASTTPQESDADGRILLAGPPGEGHLAPIPRSALVETLKTVLDLLLRQLGPLYNRSEDETRESSVCDTVEECIASIYRAIGSQEFLQTLMHAVPSPLGLKPSTPDQPFAWQGLEAALYAVACVEDSLAQACERWGQKIGQSLLRLLVGSWQMLTPDLVPEAVYAHLQELFMKVVSGLMTPLMGLLGSDGSQKRELFRFVIERSAPVAESNYVAALCVVEAMEAAFRDKVPVEEDVLALILARLQAGALKADCRLALCSAFVAGLLGSPHIQEPEPAPLTFVRTMLQHLFAGMQPALVAVTTQTPTNPAIQAACLALEDVVTVLAHATDFAAQSIPGNPLATVALEAVGDLWPALLDLLEQVDSEVLRKHVSTVCLKAIHAKASAIGSCSFLALLPSFLSTSVMVFTRPGGYHVAQPLTAAVEAYHDDPFEETQLSVTLNAISGLPEVNLLSQPEAADHFVDLAQAVMKLTIAAARQESLRPPPSHLLAEGVRRSSAASACNHRDVASLGVGCLEELTGLASSPQVCRPLEVEIVPALHQLGPLLVARLIQSIHGLHGGTRVPKVVTIFAHLVGIEGMRELLVNQWLPEAVLELQKGILTEKQAEAIRVDWLPLLMSAPAVEDTSQIWREQQWNRFRDCLRDFASGK